MNKYLVCMSIFFFSLLTTGCSTYTRTVDDENYRNISEPYNKTTIIESVEWQTADSPEVIVEVKLKHEKKRENIQVQRVEEVLEFKTWAKVLLTPVALPAYLVSLTHFNLWTETLNFELKRKEEVVDSSVDHNSFNKAHVIVDLTCDVREERKSMREYTDHRGRAVFDLTDVVIDAFENAQNDSIILNIEVRPFLGYAGAAADKIVINRRQLQEIYLQL